MGTRGILSSGLLLCLIAIAVAVAWWPCDEPTPTAPPSVLEVSDQDRPEPPESGQPQGRPAARAAAATPSDFWLENLSGRGASLLAHADEPHAVVVRGQLSVRQRPWVHPANVEVRLTRSFLDTVLPTDAGSQDDLAPTQDDPITRSDAEGRFAFRFRPTDGELFFLIDRDGPWLDYQRVRELPRIGGELDLGEIWLDDRGGISGRVVGWGSHGIESVTVRAIDDPLLGSGSELGELRGRRNVGATQFRKGGALAVGPMPRWVVRRDAFLPFPSGQTRGDGRFVLRGVRPGTHDLILQSKFGSARIQGVQVAAGRVTAIGDTQLDNVVTAEFQFSDQSGEPWIDAQIALIHAASGFGAEIVRTDAKGRASGYVSGPYRVAFAYPGGGPWLSWPALDQPALTPQWRYGRRKVRIRRPDEVTVQLTDPHGVSISGGKVRLYVQGEAFRPFDRRLPPSMQPTERTKGRYVGRAPTAAVAVAAAAGHAPAMARVTPGRPITMTMLPLHRVTVKARNRDRQPVAGALIRIQVHEHPDQDFVGAQWTLLSNDRIRVGRTDANGELSVPVWDTELSFSAEHPDYAPSPGPRRRTIAGEQIMIDMRATATLRGRLSFHRRAAPAGFRLRARLRPPGAHELANSGWLAEHLAVTGENGDYAFRGLCAGVWHVVPELPSIPGIGGPQSIEREWQVTQVSLDEGQDIWRDIEAEHTALDNPQITGTISIDGLRVHGALVRVRELDDLRRHGSEPKTRRLTTDAFGDFAFAGLRPDTECELRVDVPAQGRLQFMHREVLRTPKPGALAATRVELDIEGGGLHLLCRDDDRPFANRMLRLRRLGADRSDGAVYEVLTSARGDCRLDQLPAGDWTIEPVHGGRCEPAEIKIAPGALASATIAVVDLSPSSAAFQREALRQLRVGPSRDRHTRR